MLTKENVVRGDKIKGHYTPSKEAIFLEFTGRQTFGDDEVKIKQDGVEGCSSAHIWDVAK